MRKYKRINTKPFKIENLLKHFYIFIKKNSNFLLLFVLFGVSYYLTFSVFSNSYILDIFIKNKGYSRKCLNLRESQSNLIADIDSFYVSMRHKNLVPPVFFQNMPRGLSGVKDISTKKRVFVNILLPILVKIQNQVNAERKKVLDISYKLLESPLSDEDFFTIRSLASKYKVKMQGDAFWDYTTALEELLIKVDIIPISLSLAISAKETGWGISRFLLEGNSLFAQWVWVEHLGIVPTRRSVGQTHVVRSFDSLEDAVIAYYTNINTHSAYKEFRSIRSKMRLDDSHLDSTFLAEKLGSYSTEPTYTGEVVDIIRSNVLTKYDNSNLGLNDNYNETCLFVS